MTKTPFFKKNIKKLNILFENCELYEIPYNEVKYFSLNEVSLSLGSLYSHFRCKSAFLSFSNEALEKDYSNFQDGLSLGERLAVQDIVAIELVYEDKQEILVYVPWDDKDEFGSINTLMSFDGHNVEIRENASVAQE